MTTFNFRSIISEMQAERREHSTWLTPVAGNRTCIGLFGGYSSPAPFEHKLSFEWKLPRSSENLSLLAFLEANIPAFTAEVATAVDQSVEWQHNGKGHSDNAILVVRYKERADPEETETAWATRVYPAFERAIEKYVRRRPA